MDDYKDELASFGRRIRFFRSKIGISQEALAELAGLDRTYVGGIERGERNPSLKNIIKLSKTLGISASDLFLDDFYDK